MISRSEQRRDFTMETKVRLLESDADTFEATMMEIRHEMAGQTKVMIGILISLVTAALVLTVNVIVIGTS